MFDRKFNICFCSDFFYPNVGGVEGHMYQLSQRLTERGHKVVILTHSYGNRKGVRYLTSCVKVYYIPLAIITDQVTLPTVYSTFPIIRQIYIRENIDIVHGHGAFSPMSHEAILHARTMGLKVVFTDHSLFGFEDTASILTNKLLKFSLSDINHVICVSHTARENTVLRASLNPTDVSVIPNAVVAAEFKPDPSQRTKNRITIVVASRLVYRKGIDLLVAVIPLICEKFPVVDFLIAGDGPKRVDLEQMREMHVLQDRVTLLGSVPHEQIRGILIKGDIFLNTSLTEAFCIAIVEAACCGLLVVSTNVGGIPEVLPDDMIVYSSPNTESLIDAIESAIDLLDYVDPFVFHSRVKTMYSWADIAMRTEKVYNNIWKMPALTLAQRLIRYNNCGVFAGKIGVMVMAFDYILLLVLELIMPRENIDISPQFDRDYFKEYCSRIKNKDTQDVS